MCMYICRHIHIHIHVCVRMCIYVPQGPFENSIWPAGQMQPVGVAVMAVPLAVSPDCELALLGLGKADKRKIDKLSTRCRWSLMLADSWRNAAFAGPQSLQKRK